MKRAGVFIIILGIALTLITSLTFSTKEKFADLGIVEITHKKPHSINWPPYLGLVVIGAGFLIYFVPQKK